MDKKFQDLENLIKCRKSGKIQKIHKKYQKFIKNRKILELHNLSKTSHFSKFPNNFRISGRSENSPKICKF